MEDLMKRTKADLVKTIDNQTATIAARDARINSLLSEITDLTKNAAKHNTEKLEQARANYAKDLASVKEQYAAEIKTLRQLIDTKDREVERFRAAVDSNNNSGQWQSKYNECQTLLDKRTASFNKYIAQYGNILKIISGTLGQAIELNEYLEKDVIKHG